MASLIATPPNVPTGVHLVGSIPLDSTADVFRKAYTKLPHRLRRFPDGETGKRNYFVLNQLDVFTASPWVLPHIDPFGRPLAVHDHDVQPTDEIKLLPTGYDEAALDSWILFRALRDEGVIPAGSRFQVSLPTPVNVIGTWVLPKLQAVVEPLYEQALLSALARIQSQIPAEDLAIQWDASTEFGMLEGVQVPQILVPWFDNVREGLLERHRRLAAAVAPGVQLGYHFCYGDIMHRHFIEPRDTRLLVEMANSIIAQTDRSVDWIHMPVPKGRADEAYFAPLRELRLRPGDQTELFLGLVHAHDEQGTRARIRAAQEAVPGLAFGVATECGMGRTPVDELDSIFHISAAVSAPYDA